MVGREGVGGEEGRCRSLGLGEGDGLFDGRETHKERVLGNGMA